MGATAASSGGMRLWPLAFGSLMERGIEIFSEASRRLSALAGWKRECVLRSGCGQWLRCATQSLEPHARVGTPDLSPHCVR
jgi:hypothetical protein